MFAWFFWTGVVVLAVAGIYGLHLLCLYLEDRGYMYYLRTKPQGSAAPAMLDLREIFQPSVRHVIEVQDDKLVKHDAASDDAEPGRSGTDLP